MPSRWRRPHRLKTFKTGYAQGPGRPMLQVRDAGGNTAKRCVQRGAGSGLGSKCLSPTVCQSRMPPLVQHEVTHHSLCPTRQVACLSLHSSTWWCRTASRQQHPTNHAASGARRGCSLQCSIIQVAAARRQLVWVGAEVLLSPASCQAAVCTAAVRQLPPPRPSMTVFKRSISSFFISSSL